MEEKIYEAVKEPLENENITLVGVHFGKEDGEDTLFVTHRGVINMIYFILNDISLNYDKEAFNVTHALTYELDKEKMKIKKLF